MTTALVTGVGGQDGILAARRLVGEGYRVVGTVRPGWSSPLGVYLDGVEVIEADLRDGAAMDRVVDQMAPDEVYHLAGSTSVVESFAHRDLVAEVNDRAVARLLESCWMHVPSARVVLASSAEVFGPDAQRPRNEHTPFDPRSPYAESKVRVHAHAAAARDRGQHVAVGILFNHESPIRDRRFVTRKITCAVAQIACGRADSVTLGHLNARRDWGAAIDTIDAMVRLVRADEPRDVVIATGRLHTIGDLVEVAFAAGGVDDPWSFVDQSDDLMRTADTPGALADTTLAREWLGWSPAQTFDDLIAAMVRADLERVRSGCEEHPDFLR